MFPDISPDILVHVPRSLSAPDLLESKSSDGKIPAYYKRTGSLRLANSWQASPSSSSTSTPQLAASRHGASAEDPVAEAMASGAFTLDQMLAFPISWRNMALAMPQSSTASPVPPPAPSPRPTQVKIEPSSSRASSSKPASSKGKEKAKAKRAIKGSTRAARSVTTAAKRSSPSSSASAAAGPSMSSSTFRTSRPTLSLGQLPGWTPPRHRRASSSASSTATMPSLQLSLGMDDMPALEPCFDQSSQSGNESSNGDPRTPGSEINLELSLLPLPSVALPDMEGCMSWSAPRAQYEAFTPYEGTALGLLDSNGVGLNPWKLADQGKRTPGQPAGWSQDWSWALDETLAL